MMPSWPRLWRTTFHSLPDFLDGCHHVVWQRTSRDLGHVLLNVCWLACTKNDAVALVESSVVEDPPQSRLCHGQMVGFDLPLQLSDCGVHLNLIVHGFVHHARQVSICKSRAIHVASGQFSSQKTSGQRTAQRSDGSRSVPSRLQDIPICIEYNAMLPKNGQ